MAYTGLIHICNVTWKMLIAWHLPIICGVCENEGGSELDRKLFQTFFFSQSLSVLGFELIRDEEKCEIFGNRALKWHAE